MRWKPDQIDLWCEEWAHERRKILGLTDLEKLQPRERLGKLNSTLGQIEKWKVGAGEHTTRMGENGHPDQNWPEVYRGMALEIHRGYRAMRGEWRLVMEAQYVWRGVPAKAKAAHLKLALSEYWSRLSCVKVYLQGWIEVGGAKNVETRNSRTAAANPLTDALKCV